MTLRAGAQPGEIFTKEVAAHFTKIIQDDFAKRSAADRKAIVHELPKGAKVSINTVYPTTIPLLTFPAALLQKLPDLPPELEYRIVGRAPDPAGRQGQLGRRRDPRCGADSHAKSTQAVDHGSHPFEFSRSRCSCSPLVIGVSMRSPSRNASRRAADIEAAPAVRPPVGKDSVKFLVIGDSGTGDRAQIETAAQMWKVARVFPYEFAIMLGDNMYGSERPQDYARKFEVPFKPLLDAKIEFYASLGNHDDPNQIYYKPFGMGGKRFYTYQKKDAALLRARQQLHGSATSSAGWSRSCRSRSRSGRSPTSTIRSIRRAAGTDRKSTCARIVEPLFIKYGVNVVFAGHEHFYERLKPQKGIHYFTAGGSAKLRAGDIVVGAMTAKGFDTEQSFMLVEIDGDTMHFQTISRRGRLIDSGTITRQAAGGTS